METLRGERFRTLVFIDIGSLDWEPGFRYYCCGTVSILFAFRLKMIDCNTMVASPIESADWQKLMKRFEKFVVIGLDAWSSPNA